MGWWRVEGRLLVLALVSTLLLIFVLVLQGVAGTGVELDVVELGLVVM